MSVDTESLLNLDHDVEAVAVFLVENGGLLERDDKVHDEGGDLGVYWLTMRPRSHPADIYFVRVEWEAYPYKPPSIKFATAAGGSLTVTGAWPVITGYRASSFDICRPMSKEGYVAHPEWAEGATAWPTEGNPFLWLAQTMQFHLDNEYQGRAQ